MKTNMEKRVRKPWCVTGSEVRLYEIWRECFDKFNGKLACFNVGVPTTRQHKKDKYPRGERYALIEFKTNREALAALDWLIKEAALPREVELRFTIKKCRLYNREISVVWASGPSPLLKTYE